VRVTKQMSFGLERQLDENPSPLAGEGVAQRRMRGKRNSAEFRAKANVARPFSVHAAFLTNAAAATSPGLRPPSPTPLRCVERGSAMRVTKEGLLARSNGTTERACYFGCVERGSAVRVTKEGLLARSGRHDGACLLLWLRGEGVCHACNKGRSSKPERIRSAMTDDRPKETLLPSREKVSRSDG
jgi:hypothetical protein